MYHSQSRKDNPQNQIKHMSKSRAIGMKIGAYMVGESEGTAARAASFSEAMPRGEK